MRYLLKRCHFENLKYILSIWIVFHEVTNQISLNLPVILPLRVRPTLAHQLWLWLALLLCRLLAIFVLYVRLLIFTPGSSTREEPDMAGHQTIGSSSILYSVLATCSKKLVLKYSCGQQVGCCCVRGKHVMFTGSFVIYYFDTHSFGRLHLRKCAS